MRAKEQSLARKSVVKGTRTADVARLLTEVADFRSGLQAEEDLTEVTRGIAVRAARRLIPPLA